jgi:hypothetical protein
VSFKLRNHLIWDEFTQIVEQIDPHSLAVQHLLDINFQLNGYWSENDFYEEVLFQNPVLVELISSSIYIRQDSSKKRLIKFKFLVKADRTIDKSQHVSKFAEQLAEMELLFDENLEFFDEYWTVYLNSPFVTAKRSTDESVSTKTNTNKLISE